MYAQSIDLKQILACDGILSAEWSPSTTFSSSLILLTNQALHFVTPSIIPSSTRPTPREMRDYLQSFSLTRTIALPNPSVRYASLAVVGENLVITCTEGVYVLNCPTEQWEECMCGEVLALAKLNEEGCLVEMADGQVNMLMIASEEGECRSMMMTMMIDDDSQ